MKNGGAEEALDLQDPATAAGVLMRVSTELAEVRTEQARHGRMLDKICLALEVEPEKSDPPPPIRRTLESLQEEDVRLKKADAETSQRLEALTKEAAETKLVVRVGLIQGIPKLTRAAAMVAGGLTALAGSVWAVLSLIERIFGKMP